MIKVIYATVTGPGETIISIDNLLDFINRFSVISIEPVEVDRWQIEKVDRYWYYCGRNNREFVETTYWYDPITLRRKETSEEKFLSVGRMKCLTVSRNHGAQKIVRCSKLLMIQNDIPVLTK